MKKETQTDSKQGKKSKHKLFKPKKKKSVEEDAAITYLKAQYDKINPDNIITFKDFPLSQKTLKGLKDNNYLTPTEIQRQAIGYALQGKDILGAAKTGSGKTLAFLIPILENLFCKKWSRLDGVGAMVISPTRELAYQIYETLRKIGYLHDFSAGLIIGGQNLKFERKRMDQINILICTPGRLLQHMDENPLFDCSHLQVLILDEADRCLDLGFETTMNAIIENLPPERQTLLFSATQTKSVKDLARLSLSFPTYVAPHEQSATVTPESLQQSYIVCEIEEKLPVLWSFIKNHLKQKVLVFMATCKQVKYTYEIFCKLRPGVSLLALYGTLHQEKRERIYEEFCRKSNVVLFATDLASRGLDFPRVNWVIQYDCPEDVDTYIHRAGRTARGVFGKGEGLLVLLPQEEKIVEDLKKSKIPINKISVDPSKIIFPQRKIEELLSDSMDLKQTAQRAFVNYLKSVYLMKNKEIFNVQLLNTDAYARSLGLIVPPRIKFLGYKNNSNKDNISISKKDIIEPNSKVPESVVADHDTEESDKGSNKSSQKPLQGKLKSLAKFNFHNKYDDSFEDSFLNIKSKTIDKGHPVNEAKSGNNDLTQIQLLNSKKLSKAAVIKKMLKKKIQINTTVKFTDEDDGDSENKNLNLESLNQSNVETTETSDVLRKLKGMLQEKDKNDVVRFREKIRAKHKDKKRKLKNKSKDEESEKDDFGSQSESDSPDLSWLPDPDKVFGKNEDSKKSEFEQDTNSEHSDYVSSQEETNRIKYQRPMKRNMQKADDLHTHTKPQKLKKIEEVSASLSVQEAEKLAMQLLKLK